MRAITPLASRYWRVGIGLWATLLGVAAVIISGATTGSPPVGGDAAMFEYGGWYVSQGAIPYVDFWDVKPPLAFWIPAVLALLTGDNPLVLHRLATAVSLGAVISAVLLASEIVFDRTEDWRGAVLTGVAVSVIPSLFGTATRGFRPKLVLLVAGLAAIYVAGRRRPALSGVCAAVCVCLWQFGLVFVPIVAGLTFQQTGRKGVARATLGFSVALTLILSPVVIHGAGWAMVQQTLLAPFVASESTTILARVQGIVAFLGPGIVIWLVAVAGIIALLKNSLSDWWWLGGGALAYAGQVTLFDFDAGPDLFLLLVFCALGLGVIASHRSRELQAVLLVGLVLSFVVSLPLGPLTGVSSGTPIEHDATAEAEEMRSLLWELTPHEDCHIRMSEVERSWIHATGQSPTDQTCGDVPPERVLSALLG